MWGREAGREKGHRPGCEVRHATLFDRGYLCLFSPSLCSSFSFSNQRLYRLRCRRRDWEEGHRREGRRPSKWAARG